jgi:glycosyltransferase involved in cell wall biosynthesis
MRTSIVVLTYERPDALEMVLRSLARQTIAPDEIVVTDDGSSASTEALVSSLGRELSLPRLKFVSQEDRGARMARARNRGIAAATGDYVIFLDGDMVAARHFVEDHLAFARRGCFVQGSRALTSPELTRALLEEKRLDVSFGEPGVERRRHTLRNGLLRALWGIPSRKRKGTKSCNLAFWRDDLVRMNGFNEDMEGWGLEDVELVARAFHLGLRRRDLRMGGGAVHLWHEPKWLTDDNPNRKILDETLALRRIRCERGLDGHHVAEPRPDPAAAATLDVRFA